MLPHFEILHTPPARWGTVERRCCQNCCIPWSPCGHLTGRSAHADTASSSTGTMTPLLSEVVAVSPVGFDRLRLSSGDVLHANEGLPFARLRARPGEPPITLPLLSCAREASLPAACSPWMHGETRLSIKLVESKAALKMSLAQLCLVTKIPHVWGTN
jgi:hypothetical protein